MIIPKRTESATPDENDPKSQAKKINEQILAKLPTWTEPEPSKFNYEEDKPDERTIREQVKEFFDETSLHGLKYILEDSVTWHQRVLWLFLFCCGLVFLLYLFIPIITKYETTPTITTVGTNNYDISFIEFPGITVCSNIRISAKRFKNEMKKSPWKNYESQYVSQLVTNLVKFNSDPGLIYRMEESEKVMREQEKLIPALMYKIAPSCERMFLSCKWQGKKFNCSDIVESRKTDSGFCCSFNTVNLASRFAPQEGEEQEEPPEYDYGEDYGYDYGEEGSGSGSGDSDASGSGSGSESGSGSGSGDGVENGDGGDGSGEGSSSGSGDDGSGEDKFKYPGLLAGYENDPANKCSPESATGKVKLKSTVKKHKQVKPYEEILSTNMASQDLGFTFLLDSNIADEYANPWDEYTTNNFFQGFKLHVHSPYEFPDVSSRGLAIDIGTETFIGLSAEHTKSTDAVLAMKPSRRNCLDPSEPVVEEMGVKLKIFSEYDKDNCVLECRAAEMLKTCGCLIYYYPSFPTKFIEDMKAFYPNNTSPKNSSACSFDQLLCLANNRYKFSALVPEGGAEPEIGIVDGITCNCPDNCDSTVYIKEVTAAKLKDHNSASLRSALCESVFGDVDTKCNNTHNKYFKEEHDAFKQFHGDHECVSRTFQEKMNFTSLVHVYFKQMGITKFNKDQLFGWQDIVAQFGGTVGLCVGFSLLSGCELIYFLVFRRFFKKY